MFCHLAHFPGTVQKFCIVGESGSDDVSKVFSPPRRWMWLISRELPQWLHPFLMISGTVCNFHDSLESFKYEDFLSRQDMCCWSWLSLALEQKSAGCGSGHRTCLARLRRLPQQISPPEGLPDEECHDLQKLHCVSVWRDCVSNRKWWLSSLVLWQGVFHQDCRSRMSFESSKLLGKAAAPSSMQDISILEACSLYRLQPSVLSVWCPLAARCWLLCGFLTGWRTLWPLDFPRYFASITPVTPVWA